MVIKLDLPSCGKDKKIKDIIINILSFDWPLTLTQLNNKIKNDFQSNKSYQATYKSLLELLDEGVIIKQNNSYSLNVEWAKKLNEFSLNILNNYQNSEKKPILEGLLKINQNANITFLTFDCLANLDRAWLKIKEDYYKTLDGKKEITVWDGNHCWWLLVYPEWEYNVIKQSKKDCLSYKTCHNCTVLDKGSKKFYLDSGVKFNFSKKKVGGDMAVFGDTIMQVCLPDELRIEIDKIYNECKSPSEINIPDFIKNVLEKKVKIDLVLTKNKEIADKLKESAVNSFKISN